ncbi:MAG: tetratricopeptide repeat protein [Mesorhizobium sp.]
MRRSLAVCALVVATMSGNAFAITQARITGKVVDAATKQPIPDVVINVSATESKTFKDQYKAKKNGTYAIAVLDGTIRYKFIYSAPGYAPYEEVMKLKIGEPNSRDIELSKGSAAGTAPVAAAVAVQAADPSLIAFNEGAALANQEKNVEAIAKFNEAVAGKPDLVAGWQALARVQLRTKNYAKAIEAANKVLALDPEEIEMQAVLFESYTATGDKVKAAEAKKMMPANANGLFNDAARAINAGKDGEAEPLLKQAIAADETFAKAYYELGMVYVRAGKNASAKTNLEKYLELEPAGKDAATAKEMLKYVK